MGCLNPIPGHSVSAFCICSMRKVEVGNGNPLQYSCLENPMVGKVHGVAKNQARLSRHALLLMRKVSTFCWDWSRRRNFGSHLFHHSEIQNKELWLKKSFLFSATYQLTSSVVHLQKCQFNKFNLVYWKFWYLMTCRLRLMVTQNLLWIRQTDLSQNPKLLYSLVLKMSLKVFISSKHIVSWI